MDFSLSNLHSIAIGSGFSTTDHLLRLESLVKRGFNSSSNYYGIFLDLTKAYDLTWINGLLFKLSCLKISGSILLWFKNFILNRNLCVRLSSSVPFWGDFTRRIKSSHEQPIGGCQCQSIKAWLSFDQGNKRKSLSFFLPNDHCQFQLFKLLKAWNFLASISTANLTGNVILIAP